jgi:hypothetical protein
MTNYFIKILALLGLFFVGSCQDETQVKNDKLESTAVEFKNENSYRPLKREDWHAQNVKCYGDAIELVLIEREWRDDGAGYNWEVVSWEPKVPLIVPTRYLHQRFFWEPGDQEPFGMRLNRPEKTKKFWPVETQPKCLEEPIRIGSLTFRVTQTILDDGYFTEFPKKSIGGLAVRYLNQIISVDSSPLVTSSGRVTNTDMNFILNTFANLQVVSGHNGRKDAERNLEGFAEWRFRASIPHSQTRKVHEEVLRFVFDLVDPDYLVAWKKEHKGEKQ